MQPDDNNEQLVSNVLVHLYHSAVIGAVRSIRLILGTQQPNEAMNPRYKDLKAVYDALGSEQRRLFYDAVAAISEFAVFSALDFIGATIGLSPKRIVTNTLGSHWFTAGLLAKVLLNN